MSGTAQGVVIEGEPGIGKTRLVREWADVHVASARRVEVSGTTASSALPYCALAHLLGEVPFDAGVTLNTLSVAIEALRRRADASSGPIVLVVDDAHQLDSGSSLVVAHAVRQRLVQLVATIRRGETVDESIAALWRDGLVRRIELPALDEADAALVCADVLGGRVERGAVRALWERTRGNPLFLGEALRAGIDGRALREIEGVWCWEGPMQLGGAVATLIRDRFAGLAADRRAALELVALAEPLELDVLLHLATRDAVAELEGQGLLRVEADGLRQVIRTAHPLYGDVVLSSMSAVRAREARRRLADALDGTGGRRADDLLRVATLRLAAGSALEPERCIEAAWLAWARSDPQLTESLARAALAAGPSPDATYVLGEAMAAAGRYDDAEATWATVGEVREPESFVARLAQSRAPVLAFSLARPDEARAVLDRAAELVVDPSLLALLDATRSVIFSSERPVDGSARAQFELPVGADDEAAVWTWIGNAQSNLLDGRFDRVIIGSADIDAFVASAIETWPLASLFVGVCRFLALAHGGRLPDAAALADVSLDAALDSPEPLARTMWTEAVGYAALLAGDAATASRQFNDAIALLRLNDPGTLRFTLLEQAMARALLRDLDGAATALAEADALPPSFMLPPLAPERATAARAAADGRVSEARSVLVDHVAASRTASQPYFEAPALHDLVRCGGADRSVATRLRELAKLTANPVVESWAAQADAILSCDGAALEQLAADFAERGLFLDAAETAALAARGHEAAGVPSGVARCRRVTGDHRARCPGVSTPLLAHAELPVPLTPRELEIALLAARGRTNAELAQELAVSVRTVHAHLRSVFTKLGVNRREELRGALGEGVHGGVPSG